MLNTVELLIAEVRRYGAELRVMDGRLKAIPSGRLPAHLKGELRCAAAAVKARLQAAAPSSNDANPKPPPIRAPKTALLSPLTSQASATGSHHRVCRCGYHVYDKDRVYCPACETELARPTPASMPEDESAIAARYAALDLERREADKATSHGYDLDCEAPEHRGYLERTGRRCGCRTNTPSHGDSEEAQIDRLAIVDGWAPPGPAYGILATCQQHGVALHIDADGGLVVGKAGARSEGLTQPWPSLLSAIEAHLEAVAALVEAGWTLKAGFPTRTAA